MNDGYKKVVTLHDRKIKRFAYNQLNALLQFVNTQGEWVDLYRKALESLEGRHSESTPLFITKGFNLDAAVRELTANLVSEKFITNEPNDLIEKFVGQVYTLIFFTVIGLLNRKDLVPPIELSYPLIKDIVEMAFKQLYTKES